jgi:hypothetical protein
VSATRSPVFAAPGLQPPAIVRHKGFRSASCCWPPSRERPAFNSRGKGDRLCALQPLQGHVVTDRVIVVVDALREYQDISKLLNTYVISKINIRESGGGLADCADYTDYETERPHTC